jgi:hypothetical protein
MVFTVVSNYTQAEVDKMVDIYTENPCLEVVNKLSVLLNKPRKSIISKLVKEGVYIRKGYRTKTGEVSITKLQLVRSIEDALDTKFPDLDKAPKSTLKALSTTVVDQAQLLEDALEELKFSTENIRVKNEIFDVLEGR